MSDILSDLYEIIERRKAEREEGSYTVYLFDAGLDKILKKLGEETTETIIAAKNLERLSEEAEDADDAEEARGALKGEVSDLLYHLTIMLNALGVTPDDIEAVLRGRMQKTGNLKNPHQTDRDS